MLSVLNTVALYMIQVTTNSGILEGEVVENKYGGTYYSFRGIPYATPPIGDLRFKAPQPPKPWQGIRSAKELGPVCFQYNPTVGDTPIGSEDCLYLNVFTPDVKPPKPLPVMVWIHGGGFVWGSGNNDFYGPQFLVRHGVILVTINYRLEVLGFMSLNSEYIPGNAGMKDQVAAMRWVKNNIIYFGGDPDNITIFGESAGGASVGYHLISPMTKGLFKRAIMQSGTTASWWSQPLEPREKALVLAKQLGCYSEDDKELYKFFKSQPLENLVELRLPVIRNHKLYETEFGVVDEKQFGNNERYFYGDVIEALKNNAHEGVDVIIGYTKDEGLLTLMIANSTIDVFSNVANNYLEFFTPQQIKTNSPVKQQLQAGRKIREYYFKNDQITTSKNDILLKFLNWDMFNHDIMLQRDILAKTKNRNVYFYKFNCVTERNVMARLYKLDKVVGDRDVVCHADDLGYLFDIQVIQSVTPKLEINSKTFKIIDTVTKLWTNFAKYGNPTPDQSLGAIWTPHTLDKQNYLSIGNELVAGNNPDQEEYHLWNKIFQEFLPEWTA